MKSYTPIKYAEFLAWENTVGMYNCEAVFFPSSVCSWRKTSKTKRVRKYEKGRKRGRETYSRRQVRNPVIARAAMLNSKRLKKNLGDLSQEPDSANFLE